MPEIETSVPDTLSFHDHAVAFLDLVGQRDAMRTWLPVPAAPDQIPEFTESLRSSVGCVLELRRDIASLFKGAEERHVDVADLDPQDRGRFLSVTQTELIVGGISDSIVIAVPIRPYDEFCTALNSLELLILSISYTAAQGFANGIIFRGGLDIGLATRIAKNEVYGPALASAYQLESESAEYPRFVVGDALVQFLDRVAGQPSETEAGSQAQGVSASCRRMLVQDTDGRQMLDFLGPEVRATCHGLLSADIIARGRKFVEAEYKRFTTSGNEKLASRYFRLLQYYIARGEGGE